MDFKRKSIIKNMVTILALVLLIGSSASYANTLEGVAEKTESDISIEDVKENVDSTEMDSPNSTLGHEMILLRAVDLDDLENDLEDDYGEYDGEDTFEFRYNIRQTPAYAEVEMKGRNFKRDSSEWEDRDVDDFQKFVEDVAEEVEDKLNKKVYIHL